MLNRCLLRREVFPPMSVRTHFRDRETCRQYRQLVLQQSAMRQQSRRKKVWLSGSAEHSQTGMKVEAEAMDVAAIKGGLGQRKMQMQWSDGHKHIQQGSIHNR